MPPQVADARAILVVFTLRAYLARHQELIARRRRPLHIVAEILDAENVDHARTAGAERYGRGTGSGTEGAGAAVRRYVKRPEPVPAQAGTGMTVAIFMSELTELLGADGPLADRVPGFAPRPEQPRVHINLWQFEEPPSTEQEVVFDSFVFVPEGATSTSVPPAVLTQSSAWPNPFVDRTTIRFQLPDAGGAEIRVYGISGRLVRDLSRGSLEPGVHEVTWDGRTDRGRSVAAGLYFYRLIAGSERLARRMVLLD